MDFQRFFSTIKKYLSSFWAWLKPYLVQFHHWRKRIWKKYHVNKILLLLGLIVVLVMSIYLFYIAKTTKVQELKAGLQEETVIYDKQENEAGSVSSQKGTYIGVEDMSPYVVDAVVSTEDRNFYQHRGFDIKGIARAGLRMVIRRNASGGGGSTITQQLAKNAYLSLDQTFNRKAKELFLAIEIEKNYSKDEIMSMYLNNSYFGNGVWGVQDAARKYFGVDAADLTLGESATIAGMLKGPSLYNPIDHPENASNRRDTILQVMVDNNKISKEEAQQEEQVAISDLVNDTYQQEDEGYQYPYYFDAVIEEAEEKYDIKADDLMNRGYKIYTDLDTNFQNGMQEVYDNGNNFPADAEDGTMVQSASVAVDPNTGGIQAMVGRRGEHTFRGFNFATDMKRSPGSTIKPLSVYTPALEAGYMPDSTLKDEPQDYYDAKNFNGEHEGDVPMYEAVARSLNLPAVWMLHELGINKGYNKTKEFGLELTDSDKYYGLALGGLEYGTSPVQMAGAYGSFANGGTLYTPHLITKIVDANGAVIVDNTKPKGEKIISKETSNEMTSMLLGTFSNGTASSANPYGYTVAGKTGTTETDYDPDQNKDQWIVGYTPDTVISTWLGFEETDEEHNFSGTSGDVVGQIFKAQAENMLPYSNNTQFDVADAYATGGKVEESSETEEDSEDEGEDGWKQNVDQFTDDARQGMNEFGERVKEGGKELIQGFKERFNNN
ncbi:PBP1A family penicillin-binding protein [Tetragenococcus halophilus]|uniref:PBP1A family penicillin-binding protein n=2 Tax=Tetragenococcus halophilus TaxID=51669 RepID=UPI000B925C2F|nr:PBP1A family penicillin-binding protein [Tetragenococcus halophilus]MCO7025928.1 PBP1A family penicillin-binding protein [Tetragenococcus halophilus]NWO00790.1 PBP1A family penicillin-binding protein [Tetragenococcus halophilus]QXN86970.1 PBP1A family penicillin-binding protein [Tetragenococcus halophilus]GBD60692.1 penicillin-binding protein 2a [Tetragenococcus halophilus subsp. halophilus]GBD73387.1 penicillin-binding protein 2a [Tetragenococcus halophilus subsp. halophilus]